MQINIAWGHVRDLHRYTAGQRFETSTGRIYEVESAWTANDDKGRSRDYVRVNVFNPEIGHGWQGVMLAHDLTWELRAEERQAERATV